MWRFVQIYQATQYRRLTLLLVFPVLLLITLKGMQNDRHIWYTNSGISTGLGIWLIWLGTFPEIIWIRIYSSISLGLQLFLTIAIILRLLKHTAQTQSVLGEASVGHYSFLSIVFAEAAVMNVICSLFLFIASFPTRYLYGSWESFAQKCYEIFTAITPAVQVRPQGIKHIVHLSLILLVF